MAIELNYSISGLQELIKTRGDEYDWYVLRYDLETTSYNNKIVFKKYKDALEEFNNSEPEYPKERIELIFSPLAEDEEYFDNELIMYKTFNKGE